MTDGSIECGAREQPHESPVTRGRPQGFRSLDVRRVYVALIFVPVFYLLVRYLPPAAFFGLVVVVALSALIEFYRLHFHDRQSTATIVLGLTLAGILLISLNWPGAIAERWALLLIATIPLISRLSMPGDLRHCLLDSAVLTFGILYVALNLGHLVLTRALPDGAFLILFVVLVTWAGDTGAYYAGTLLGQRKLAPTVSPNKTVEGLVGGLLLALATALAARAWFLPSFTVTDCLMTGFLLTCAGALGDLSESALKRSAGVKDSGVFLPAHGGMLDRIDSLLFTAPTFYYYVTLIKG